MHGTDLDGAAHDAIGRFLKNAEVAAMPSALLDRQCRATLPARRQDARRAASALTLQLIRSEDNIAALLLASCGLLIGPNTQPPAIPHGLLWLRRY